MNELIKVTNNSIGSRKTATVDARELHKILQIGRKFNAWIGGRIDEYEFKEGVDYVKIRSQTGPNLKRFEVEYILSIDMAKELAMVERNENGRIARKYFIEVEKKYTQDLSTDKNLGVYGGAEMAFKSLSSVAEMFGLEKNQALLAANKAVKREMGVDFQAMLQIELKNPQQTRAFTPTELGAREGISAIKFNKRLQAAGLQEKKGKVWAATNEGKKYSVLLDANKAHSNGTPIQQLKWYESVLELPAMERF